MRNGRPSCSRCQTLVTPTPELAADESGIVAVLRAKITDQQHQMSALRAENQRLQHEVAIAHSTIKNTSIGSDRGSERAPAVESAPGRLGPWRRREAPRQIQAGGPISKADSSMVGRLSSWPRNPHNP
jgi:hypothetical protein